MDPPQVRNECLKSKHWHLISNFNGGLIYCKTGPEAVTEEGSQAAFDLGQHLWNKVSQDKSIRGRGLG